MCIRDRSTLPLSYITSPIKQFTYYFFKYLREMDSHINYYKVVKRALFSRWMGVGKNASTVGYRSRAPTIRPHRSARSRPPKILEKKSPSQSSQEAEGEDGKQRLNRYRKEIIETQEIRFLGFFLLTNECTSTWLDREQLTGQVKGNG